MKIWKVTLGSGKELKEAVDSATPDFLVTIVGYTDEELQNEEEIDTIEVSLKDVIQSYGKQFVDACLPKEVRDEKDKLIGIWEFQNAIKNIAYKKWSEKNSQSSSPLVDGVDYEGFGSGEDVIVLNKELIPSRGEALGRFIGKKLRLGRYNESVGKAKNMVLTEKRWEVTLSSGKALRNAIHNEDYQGIIDGIVACYDEMFDNGIIDDYDHDTWIEDVLDIDITSPDVEDDINYELNNLYDACDNLDCWIALGESLDEGANSQKVYVVEPHKIDMDLYDIVFIDTGKRASSKRFESYEDAVKFIKKNAKYNNWIAGDKADFQSKEDKLTDFGKSIKSSKINESLKEGWESIDGIKFTRTGVHGEKLDDDWIDYKDYLINKNRLEGEMLRDFKEENGYTRADEDKDEFWNEFDNFISERGLEYLDKTVNESLIRESYDVTDISHIRDVVYSWCQDMSNEEIIEILSKLISELQQDEDGLDESLSSKDETKVRILLNKRIPRSDVVEDIIESINQFPIRTHKDKLRLAKRIKDIYPVDDWAMEQIIAYAELNKNESLDEDYNKQELINAVQSAYGFNKKEAKDYIKTIDDKTKEELIKGFKRDAEKSFLIDSLNESYAYVIYYDNDGSQKEKAINGTSVKMVEAKVKKLADRYEIKEISQASKDVANSKYLNSLGRGVRRIDNSNETFEESINEALYRFTTTQEDGTPGVEIVASSREEAAKKLGILEKKRNNDRVRPLEEIHKIAMKLYNKEDDFSFNLFSDEELAMLFANTLADPRIPYDDEVFEAISNFPNRREIFDRAHKLADDFKNEGYSRKLGDSEKQLIESATKRKLVEEDDNSDSTNWLKVISKPIPDSDGFLTDYTMYRDLDDPEHYVFVFGDNELYGPEDSSNWDHEVFNGEEATDWYNDYNGIDEADTSIESEEIFDDEDLSSDDSEESDNTIGSYFSNYLDDEEDI